MKRIVSAVTTLLLMTGASIALSLPASAATPSYVALGDSVAAGAGLPSLTNPTERDETCDRSSSAYPYQVARELNTTVLNLGCTGAKIDGGLYGKQSRAGTSIPAQIPVAFANGVPDIMTITVGANDARWTQSIRGCYVWSCGNKFDVARAKLYRADLRIELYRALYQVYKLSDGAEPPRVLVSGYYTPLASTIDCVETNGRITATEVAWLQQQTADLNQAIQSVIPYFWFAEYVPVDFTGHEVCTDNSWIQGANDAAPFHPTAQGQSAIARAYLNALTDQ